MQKQSKRNLLIQSVLASSFFVVPIAAQAIDIITSVDGPISTSGNGGIVFISPSGQVTNDGTKGNGDGVDLDGAGNFVIIEPANTHKSGNPSVFGAGAIDITGGAGNGIRVTAPNGFIFVGNQSGITVSNKSLGNVINIAKTGVGTIIDNAGTLQTANGATGDIIEVFGKDTTLNNLLGGVIQNQPGSLTDNATILIDLTTSGFKLENNGVITQSNELINTIEVDGSFTSITNQSNGVISQTDKANIKGAHLIGNALSINNTSGGDITNAGLITIPSSSSNTILISNFTGKAMVIGSINNSGTISHDAGVSGDALSIFVDKLAGSITVDGIFNTGTFSSDNHDLGTISTQSNGGIGNIILTNGLVNNGDIRIEVIGGVVAVNFSYEGTQATIFQNGGTISGNVLLAPRAPVLGAPVLEMTGGTIAGDVVGEFIHQNIYDVTGGEITGILFFGNQGDTLNLSDTGFINVIQGNAGSGKGAAVAIDTFNLGPGGGFNFLNTTQDPTNADVSNINIIGTFIQNGTINGFNNANKSIVNINVENAGTVYTANGPIFGLNGLLTVDAGTTFIPNDRINFTGGPGTGLKNNGTVLITGEPLFNMLSGATFVSDPSTVILAPGGKLTINGDATPNVFEVLTGSSLVVGINGLCPPGGDFESGLLVVNSTVAPGAVGSVVNLEAGSFIVPQFSGVMLDGAEFSFIVVNDGTGAPLPAGSHFINNQATIIQPASATVFFTDELRPLELPLQGEEKVLIAHRNPFAGFDAGIGGVFDVILAEGVCDADLCPVISQLDQLPTGADVSAALDSLTPQHNYGLIAASHIGVDSMFEGITDRVWDVAWHHRDHGRRHSGRPVHIHDTVHHKHPVKVQKTTAPSYQMTKEGGVSFGDLYNTAGIWLRPILAYVDQSSDDDVAGYKAKAWGGAIGFDWGVTDCTTLGAAISYTHVNVDDKAWAPKDEEVEAWMGTLYGSFDFTHGIFFDAMIAGAHNDYDVNRVIAVNSLLTAAESSFDGTTWAAQADLGMALPNVNFFLAPFARLKWVHVNFDDFTETGADGLDLAVSTDDATEFLGGIGIRMAGDLEYCGVDWVPELMAMIGYDFTLDGEDTLANFVDCGPSFATDGVTPGRTVFDLGLALNALICDNSVITAKYNLELREDFVSNTAYLQLFYTWS